MNWLLHLTGEKKIVAVGEIGLDYHWDVEPREVQKEWFVRQLSLAKEAKLPVIIHSRDAAKDTFDIIREHHAGTTEASSTATAVPGRWRGIIWIWDITSASGASSLSRTPE